MHSPSKANKAGHAKLGSTSVGKKKTPVASWKSLANNTRAAKLKIAR